MIITIHAWGWNTHISSACSIYLEHFPIVDNKWKSLHKVVTTVLWKFSWLASSRKAPSKGIVRAFSEKKNNNNKKQLISFVLTEWRSLKVYLKEGYRQMVSEMTNPWKIETRQINDSVLLGVSMNTDVMRNTARAS